MYNRPALIGCKQILSVCPFARVAELVDALDLGSSVARRESSSLSFRTIIIPMFMKLVLCLALCIKC